MRILFLSLLLFSSLFSSTPVASKQVSKPHVAPLEIRPFKDVAPLPKDVLTLPDPNSDVRLRKIEAYFNNLTSLKASFLQTNNARSLLRGVFYIQKPGKMRVDYGNDSPLLLIADGLWVINYDKELNQSSHIPLSSHPAEVLLRSNLSFKEGFNVKKILSHQGVLTLTLTKTDAMEAGMLSFVFLESPLELREWIVVDARGNSIRVELRGIQKNMPLPSSLFIAPKNNSFSPQ